jgi:hypothetical protein
MLALDAMRAARFSVLCIERRHEIAGLIATDIFRRTEVWLIDIGLEGSVPDGSLIATRLYTPERFATTVGVNVPFDPEIVEDLVAELPRHLREKPLAAIIDDRRFAETIYRVALAGAESWSESSIRTRYGQKIESTGMTLRRSTDNCCRRQRFSANIACPARLTISKDAAPRLRISAAGVRSNALCRPLMSTAESTRLTQWNRMDLALPPHMG